MSVPRETPLSYDRRVIEPDGTVHAGRFAGDRHSFTTACAVYPAPPAIRIEPRPARAVTCRGCVVATTPTAVPLTAVQFLAVTDARPYIPELDHGQDDDPEG
ncbi:hypothetical protein ACWGCC_30395 [Streptomyces nigrescens]